MPDLQSGMPSARREYRGGKERMKKKVLTGNHAAGISAMLCRPQVIAAYPITPQTTIVEKLADLAVGRKDVKFIKVESEHSAMAVCVAAALMGKRVFTATSSHGLVLMHEVLHWAANCRLPVVMINANRALGAPWNINTEQTDSLSQRDTGWLQMYCSTNQEVMDMVIQAYAITEKVNLPLMINMDGFLLTHTVEPVIIPTQEEVDAFLPPYKPAFKVSTEKPFSVGTHHSPDHYMELKKNISDFFGVAGEVIREVSSEFAEKFGRSYSLIGKYQTDDAEIILITTGTTVETAKIAVDNLRKKNQKVGLVNLRFVRPFPIHELFLAIRNTKRIAVLDRSFTGNQGGILAQEIKSAFYNAADALVGKPIIHSFVAGLGGRDITVETIEQIFSISKDNEDKNFGDRYHFDITSWIGVKDEY
jgi:2-oxoisovalerate ferredoxin oxidoreductase alpha subunit